MSLNHSFRLLLGRWPADSEWDELADTCHDAGFGKSNGVPQAEFDRVADNLTEAIISAIHELRAHHAVETVGIEPVLWVWNPDIADRAGLPDHELNARIAASPVAHSKPMPRPVGEGSAVSYYHWSEVAEWLAAHGIPQAYDKTIQAAQSMLAAVDVEDRTPDRMRRRVQYELKRIDMWRVPEWMEPYRSFIAETGGNEIEELVFSFDHDRNLARTNWPRFTLACMARAQVGLLQRLHEDGSLPPAPNAPGGW